MSTALFDLSDFDPAPVYAGPVPRHFTRDYFTPDELSEAAAFYGRGHHGWLRTFADAAGSGPRGCDLSEFTADLRCSTSIHGDRMFWRQATPMHLFEKGLRDDDPRCECVGTLITMTNCSVHRWHAIGEGRDTRTAWLDHAWPGWRDLPIIPAELTPPYGGAIIPKNGSPNPEDVKAGKAGYEWARAHYPAEFQVPGAPAIAQLRPGRGSRGVIGGYSPFGGFLVNVGVA